MKKYKVTKIKRNLYKYGNAISYGMIFAIATIITIVAAAGRAENVAYVDESQLITADALDIKDSETQKVAANETTAMTETEVVTTPAETTPEVTEPENTAVSKIKIIADSLNVRKSASSDAEPMGEVVMDEIYEVLGYEGQWIKIKFGNDEGYISAAYVKATE